MTRGIQLKCGGKLLSRVIKLVACTRAVHTTLHRVAVREAVQGD